MSERQPKKRRLEEVDGRENTDDALFNAAPTDPAIAGWIRLAEEEPPEILTTPPPQRDPLLGSPQDYDVDELLTDTLNTLAPQATSNFNADHMEPSFDMFNNWVHDDEAPGTENFGFDQYGTSWSGYDPFAPAPPDQNYPMYPRMDSSQEDVRYGVNADYGQQPGPSRSCYNQHPGQQPRQSHPHVNNNVQPMNGNNGQQRASRVRDERNELLKEWRFPQWTSEKWKELFEKYISTELPFFPPPPGPAYLYARKPNGRKMHEDNELDPYFHLTDADANTLMEGAARGNEMIRDGVELYIRAGSEEAKKEASRNLWKSILTRVINNRQSAGIKNRSICEQGLFVQGAATVCQAMEAYRLITIRLLNNQMLREQAERELREIDHSISVTHEGYSNNKSLFAFVKEFAETESKKKPTKPRKHSQEPKTPRGRKKK